MPNLTSLSIPLLPPTSWSGGTSSYKALANPKSLLLHSINFLDFIIQPSLCVAFKKKEKEKKPTNYTGNGTRSLDLLRSNPMFVGTEKNLTIYVSKKLRKQKPEISQLGRCTFLSVQGAFLPFCSVLRVD